MSTTQRDDLFVNLKLRPTQIRVMNMKKLLIFICSVFVSTFFSCSKDDGGSKSVITHWALICSTDLLDYVDPIVTYTDESGKKVEVSLSDYNWNGSGKIRLGDATNYSELTNIGNAWQTSVKGNSFGISLELEVRYVLKEGKEFDASKDYEFAHDIVCHVNTASDNNFNQNSRTNLTIGQKTKGDEVEMYIKSLVATPDKRVVTIDSQGKITIN